MSSPDNKLFCRLDGLTPATREQQRLQAMTELGLLESESIPVFEEAIQTAAHFLEAPICLLSLVAQETQWFKSAVGLSRLGLMNELATSRKLTRSEGFCTYVVDSQQTLVIADTTSHPAFAASVLTQQYGIRAYLGVPLMASHGICLGTLAVMDLAPRVFTHREAEFLELTARWSMSEFERRRLLKQPASAPGPQLTTAPPALNPTTQVKVELLAQLTQELRTPLTSVMGMASVLTHEIYGPLTTKQKEYLDIVHHSGQYLLSLVNEILELSALEDGGPTLNLTSVDIEMLCQQAINTLEQAALRREQQIRLSVEPGSRIWLLDKNKVRQILYHLIFSVIQSSNAGSIIRVHVSRKTNGLNIAIWISHPWLGEGLPYADLTPPLPLVTPQGDLETSLYEAGLRSPTNRHSEEFMLPDGQTDDEVNPENQSARRNLGLLLSHHLAEMHGGRVTLQGTVDSGYRYVVSLPHLASVDELARTTSEVC